MDEHLKKIQEDVDLMNKTFSGEKVDEPEPEPEPKPEQSPEAKTDAPSTEAPIELVDEAEVKTEPPSTPIPVDKDQVIADLRTKLAEKEMPVEQPKPELKSEPLKFDDQDFIGELDLDDLTRDPKEFNKLLNKIYQKAVTDTHEKVGGQFTQTIPNMISTVTELQRGVENFYKENKDLEPFKKVVANVFEDLVTKNPNKPYAELMTETAPEVRKRLELPTPTSKVAKPDPPKLPRKKGKSGRSEETPTLNPLQAELEEMNKILRR